MNKLKIILSICSLGLCMPLWSQNPMIYHGQIGNSIGSLFPELNGWHGGAQINGGSRQMFTGFEGRPQNNLISGDVFLPRTNSTLGIAVYTEGLGQIRSSQAAFNYSHRISLGELYLLPAIGYARHQFKMGSNWNGNESYHIDGNQLSGGIGFVYSRWFGALHYSGSVQYNSLDYQVWNGQLYFYNPSTNPYYSAICGRSISINQWTFNKSVVARSNLHSIQLDFNFNANYKRWMGGVRYVFTDGLIVGLGYDILDRYRISYSREFGLSRIRRGSNGTHELGFRILLNSKSDHRILKNFALF